MCYICVSVSLFPALRADTALVRMHVHCGEFGWRSRGTKKRSLPAVINRQSCAFRKKYVLLRLMSREAIIRLQSSERRKKERKGEMEKETAWKYQKFVCSTTKRIKLPEIKGGKGKGVKGFSTTLLLKMSSFFSFNETLREQQQHV